MQTSVIKNHKKIIKIKYLSTVQKTKMTLSPKSLNLEKDQKQKL